MSYRASRLTTLLCWELGEQQHPSTLQHKPCDRHNGGDAVIAQPEGCQKCSFQVGDAAEEQVNKVLAASQGLGHHLAAAKTLGVEWRLTGGLAECGQEKFLEQAREGLPGPCRPPVETRLMLPCLPTLLPLPGQQLMPGPQETLVGPGRLARGSAPLPPPQGQPVPPCPGRKCVFKVGQGSRS